MNYLSLLILAVTLVTPAKQSPFACNLKGLTAAERIFQVVAPELPAETPGVLEPGAVTRGATIFTSQRPMTNARPQTASNTRKTLIQVGPSASQANTASKAICSGHKA